MLICYLFFDDSLQLDSHTDILDGRGHYILPKLNAFTFKTYFAKQS